MHLAIFLGFLVSDDPKSRVRVLAYSQYGSTTCNALSMLIRLRNHFTGLTSNNRDTVIPRVSWYLGVSRSPSSNSLPNCTSYLVFRIPKLSFFPFCPDLCFCVEMGLDIGHEGYRLNLFLECFWYFHAIASLVFRHFIDIKTANIHPSLERLISCLDVDWADVRGKSTGQAFPFIAFTIPQRGPLIYQLLLFFFLVLISPSTFSQ